MRRIAEIIRSFFFRYIVGPLDDLFEDIARHLSTVIWCGYCGSSHRFSATQLDVICPKTNQPLQSKYAWRVYSNRGAGKSRYVEIRYVWEQDPTVKTDIFIAWDNYDKLTLTPEAYEEKQKRRAAVHVLIDENHAQCKKHNPPNCKQCEKCTDPNVCKKCAAIFILRENIGL